MLGIVQEPLPTVCHALRFEMLHRIPRALADDFPLPLADTGQQIHHHPARRRGGVQTFLQADQGHALPPKGFISRSRSLTLRVSRSSL